jgi:hypothetical protein
MLSTVYWLEHVTFDVITSQETITKATQLDNSRDGNEVEAGMGLRCEPGGFSQNPTFHTARTDTP